MKDTPHDYLGDPAIIQREDVINDIKKNVLYMTYTWGRDKRWYQGDRVDFYTSTEGVEFIQTAGNKIPGDNLGNLPDV